MRYFPDSGGKNMNNSFRRDTFLTVASLAPAVLMSVLGVLGTASRTLSAETNTWTSLGPEGGTLVRLVPDLQNPGAVYANGPYGSIFKTTDGAQSWSASP